MTSQKVHPTLQELLNDNIALSPKHQELLMAVNKLLTLGHYTPPTDGTGSPTFRANTADIIKGLRDRIAKLTKQRDERNAQIVALKQQSRSHLTDADYWQEQYADLVQVVNNHADKE